MRGKRRQETGDRRDRRQERGATRSLRYYDARDLSLCDFMCRLQTLICLITLICQLIAPARLLVRPLATVPKTAEDLCSLPGIGAFSASGVIGVGVVVVGGVVVGSSRSRSRSDSSSSSSDRSHSRSGLV